VTAPVTVSELSHPTAITAGYFHNCALMPTSTIQCWGINQSGALGNPTPTSTQIPVTVSGITDAVAVDAGETLSCAALASGRVQCWGDNPYGALGNGSSGNHSDVPVTVNGITDGVSVAAGATFACALHAGGTIACWGNNWWNQLGDGTGGEGVSCANPVGVEGITDAVMLVAGSVHACALLRDRTVKWWGYGYYGQLGNGTSPHRSGPVTVSDLGNVVALDAGEYHTCAVLGDGTVRCWGGNGNGQLGDGTRTASSVPVTAAGF
jgi:alpha-tubulin suppressor-like RCC1 family protein